MCNALFHGFGQHPVKFNNPLKFSSYTVLTKCFEVGQVAVLIEKEVIQHEQLSWEGVLALVGVRVRLEDREDLGGREGGREEGGGRKEGGRGRKGRGREGGKEGEEIREKERKEKKGRGRKRKSCSQKVKPPYKDTSSAEKGVWFLEVVAVM